MAIISLTFLPFITESGTGTISYKPQRVMRLLGYDQFTIQITGEMGCSNSITAESQFIGKGNEQIIPKFQNFFGWTVRESE